MLFVGTSIIHPSTEGVFLLCNILDLLIYSNQLESAKIEVTKPFQQEEELAEKLKRLAELNALLNMDEKGTDALILEDDEQPAIVNSDMAVTPITSVKTKPMLKKKVVGLCL